MDITSEIFQVGGNGFSAPEDAAVYLVAINNRGVLVDAGCGGSVEKILNHIRGCGIDPADIDLLLLTHCHYDHSGGAAAIKTACDCKILVHEADAEFLAAGDDRTTAANWYNAEMAPLDVDTRIQGRHHTIDFMGRAIHALHCPGHTPGSVVYWLDSDGLRVVFAQDVHGPLNSAFRSNTLDYQASLKRLLALEADVLCEGHFGVFRGKQAVARFIRQFISPKPAV